MSGEEEVKTIEMTPAQKEKAAKDAQRQQALQINAYKKRLREGNELKKLQVEELELNIRYYTAKRQWFDLRDKIEKLDKEEQEVLAQEQAKRAEMQRLHEEALEKKKEMKEKEEKAPDIVIPKQGKPRDK